MHAAPRAAYRHRIPLGLLLLSRRQISSRQLQQAVARQRAHSETSIGECLQQLGAISEQQVTTAVAAQWGCPTFFAPVLENLEPHFVPAELLLRHEMVPVHWNPHQRLLYLGFLRAVNYPALGAVEKVLACRVEPCFLRASELRHALSHIHEQKSGGLAAFAPGLGPEQIAEIVLSYAAQTGAEEIRTAITPEYIWARMTAAQPLDLIFELRGQPSIVG
jgi:predicted metallopeptidase